jgi:hypothetical protein
MTNGVRSRSLSSVNSAGRPPERPRARAARSPGLVRSRFRFARTPPDAGPCRADPEKTPLASRLVRRPVYRVRANECPGNRSSYCELDAKAGQFAQIWQRHRARLDARPGFSSRVPCSLVFSRLPLLKLWGNRGEIMISGKEKPPEPGYFPLFQRFFWWS